MGGKQSVSSPVFTEQFQKDKELVDSDHKKHLSDLQDSIPKEAVLLYRKPLVYPAEGTPAEIQAGIGRICVKFFAGSQIPRQVLGMGIDWITTAFEEIVSEGELLVMNSTKGLKPLFTLTSHGNHNYYLIGTARYQVEVTKLVKRSEGGQKVLNRDKSRIAVTWSAIIEVRRTTSSVSQRHNLPLSHAQSPHSLQMSPTHLFSMEQPPGYTPINTRCFASSHPPQSKPTIQQEGDIHSGDEEYMQII